MREISMMTLPTLPFGIAFTHALLQATDHTHVDLPLYSYRLGHHRPVRRAGREKLGRARPLEHDKCDWSVLGKALLG